MKEKRYIGIADAHGIESFLPKDKDYPTALMLRASCNRQRHALCYEVMLNDKDKTTVDNFIQQQDFKGALTFIKGQKTFAVESSMSRSAKMIPNDDLDPYWGQ